MSQPNPSGKVRNLYAQLCKCIGILGSRVSRPQPTPPRDDNCETVQHRLHVTASAIHLYIYIYSSENAQSWQIERLNKYSAPIRDRYLFERQHSKVLEESWREVWTHLCIKRDSSLIGGVSSHPRIASCAPNFATVREFTARSFRHSGKNGSRLNVNCSVIFPPGLI